MDDKYIQDTDCFKDADKKTAEDFEREVKECNDKVILEAFGGKRIVKSEGVGVGEAGGGDG